MVEEQAVLEIQKMTDDKRKKRSDSDLTGKTYESIGTASVKEKKETQDDTDD